MHHKATEAAIRYTLPREQAPFISVELTSEKAHIQLGCKCMLVFCYHRLKFVLALRKHCHCQKQIVHTLRYALLITTLAQLK